MISHGSCSALGIYDNKTETFTTTKRADGYPLSFSVGGAGKYGWMITNECDDRVLTFGWLAATCGNCKPQVGVSHQSCLVLS